MHFWKKGIFNKISLVVKIVHIVCALILPDIDAELSTSNILNHHSGTTCLKAVGTQYLTISLTYLWEKLL